MFLELFDLYVILSANMFINLSFEEACRRHLLEKLDAFILAYLHRIRPAMSASGAFFRC